MPTVPNPLSALGIVSPTAKAIKAFRARNEIRTLFGHLERDVRHSDLLPFGAADAVVERLNGLLVQPEIEGALIKWLGDGDDGVREPLQARFAQLLVFEEHGIDSQQLAAVVVTSLDKNLARAKRSDREATILEGERTRGRIDELKEQLADVGSVGPAPPVTARSLQIAGAMFELPPTQADTVQKLVRADPEGAVPVQEALAAGGVGRVADAIDESRPWLEQSSAEVWEAAGRLAESVGRMAQAQRAYERAADHPAVGDRVRQLVRASSAAAAREDHAREKELMDAARTEDDQNPAVLLRDARDSEDPDATLEQLDRIVAVDDDQAASVEIVRVEALMSKRDFGQAREALARVRSLQTDERGADELEANLVITEAQVGLPDDHEAPPEPMLAAAQTFVRLANEMRDQERWYGVAILTGRAIVAFALAGSSGEASQLLDEAMRDDRLLTTVEARRLLASGALLLQRLDDVLVLVPQSGDETDRLDRAAAHVMSGDPARGAGQVDELTELMNAGGEGSSRAAYLLLCAATNNAAVEWNEGAVRIVTAEQPWTATMLRAFRLATEGDLDGAEAHLRPHTENPTALRYLVHLAARGEEYEKALRLSETLVQRTGAAADRLQLAALLAQKGERDTATDRLLALARDQSASFDQRRTAFARAARLTQEAGRFPELETLALEWATVDDGDDARWMAILAMAMRFRHTAALKTWHDLGEPEANSPARARLLGEVFALAAEPVDALQMLAMLSDRFERPEELEAALIFGSIRLEPATAELSPELADRIRESFATFPRRFPDSTMLRAIPVDVENPAESLLAAFGEQLEQRAERTEELATGIRGGVNAVALLASAAGRSIGETLFLLQALPLDFPDDQFDRLDRADAAAAYDVGAAVWDASAIFVVGALSAELEGRLRSVLPASGIVRATLEDAAQDLAAPGSEERGEISVVEGVLAFGTWSNENVRANRHRATETQRLATTLSTLPLSASDDDELLVIAHREDAPAAIRSWSGTLALARQEGLAVFSDDRVVRRSARELGLKTFGTLALLDVLADHGVIAVGERDEVRHRLLARGAWGVRHSVDELIRLGREAAWQPTNGLRAALGDTTAWVALQTRWAERVLAFLDAVAREAPEQMGKWVHRAIDAVTHDVGGDYLRHASLFLLVAINPLEDPPRMSDTGLGSLISSLRRMRYFEVFKPPRDLLVSAVADLLTTSEDATLRALMFRRVSDRLDAEDQELLRRHFVR
jgi:predicted nucleic acid-binding protein/tetratricopeptide (TPR) repeat protein